jgi:hypothetical protein
MLKAFYKKYSTILGKVKKEANKLYYYELINKSKNGVWTTWKIIKKETLKMHRIDNILHIEIEAKKKDPWESSS